jgi:hypothetical protein
MQCDLPLCDSHALPPLQCGHKLCGACMLGMVKLSGPSFPILIITCPLCRDRSMLQGESLAVLMLAHKPQGTLLMDCLDSNEGFCLAMQSKPKRKSMLTMPSFFFLQLPYYLKYLAGFSPDECDVNTLFDQLSKRARTRMDAIWLLADMPFPAPPFPLLEPTDLAGVVSEVTDFISDLAAFVGADSAAADEPVNTDG